MAEYTLEQQMKLIKKNVFNLVVIDNVYEEVCLEAVKQDVLAITYIKRKKIN